MARVVRKVSNKNIANANKKKKVNKWLIGGIIAGVVVAIAVAVILWVTLGNNGEEEHYDYLNTYQLVEGEEVKFQKANYNALLNMMNEEYVGYVDGIIIVLAYNSETLVPEDEDLKDLSVVKTDLNVNGHSIGKIALVGPRRMDYDQVLSALEYVIERFEEVYNDLGEDEKDEERKAS